MASQLAKVWRRVRNDHLPSVRDTFIELQVADASEERFGHFRDLSAAPCLEHEFNRFAFLFLFQHLADLGGRVGVPRPAAFRVRNVDVSVS